MSVVNSMVRENELKEDEKREGVERRRERVKVESWTDKVFGNEGRLGEQSRGREEKKTKAGN